MPEYSFELERSAYFKNRAKLLKSKLSPKLSQAKSNLGDTLSKVVFEQCEDALQEDFGLNMPLKGPGPVLWVSPSDLLIGKIALKPPFTPKCLQALTHKGILEIGLNLEQKFREEMEMDKLRALEKYKYELLQSVEDRMKSEIKDVEIRERLNCQVEMEKQQQDFELILKDELDKLEARIREQYEKIIANHDSYMKAKWEDKLRDEVQKTVDLMTRSYLAQLDEQENRLTEKFKLEIKKHEILRDFDAQLNKFKTTEALRQLKHNLECTNLVNMMYILCTERQKCCDQKAAIEMRYKIEIQNLEEKIGTKCAELKAELKEKERQIIEVLIREKCLREVIKHFQKFINFALRAAPTQAEFLLSVEKMMSFELTSEVVKAKKITPKFKELPPIIQWMHEEKIQSDLKKDANLVLEDHHNCFNELNPPVKEILDESDALPAIYFKDKMYVREDFRDMLSSGVPLTPSNELWNRDVEILVANWREKYVDVPLSDTESFDKESILIKIEEVKSEKMDIQSLQHSTGTDRRRSNKSTVQFTEDSPTQTCKASISVVSRQLSRKSSLKPGAFISDGVEETPKLNSVKAVTSKLLAAKDSLEVIIEQRRKSQKYSSAKLAASSQKDSPKNAESSAEVVTTIIDSKPSDITKELVIETRDSVIMTLSEMAKSHSSGQFLSLPRDSIELAKHVQEEKIGEVHSKQSKLSMAKSSIEMLRESLQKMRIPSRVCQKSDQLSSKAKLELKSEKSVTASPSGFQALCCDKCKRKDKDYGLETASLRSGDERSVKISRIQIINLDDHVPTPSVVSFNTTPMFFKEKSTSNNKDTTLMEVKSRYYSPSYRIRQTKKPAKKPNKLPQSPKCKIFGDFAANQGDQQIQEFTTERIHSLVKLMSDQPHLIQLFTAGIR